MFPAHVFLQLVCLVSDVVTNSAGQSLAVCSVQVMLERLSRPARDATLSAGHVSPVDCPHVSLLLNVTLELHITVADVLSDLVPVEVGPK